MSSVPEPSAVCYLQRRLFSAKRTYDEKMVISLNSQIATDVCGCCTTQKYVILTNKFKINRLYLNDLQ